MEGMIKGYSVRASAQFVLEDEGLRGRIPEDFLETVAAKTSTLKPGHWYPRAEVMTLWRAVADAGEGEAAAYDNLIRCGEFSANAAAGTFLKFLLKVLTPRMFARKLPDFWAHDHQGGRIEVERGEDKALTIWIKDIEGFDHVSAITTGFVGFALRATGLRNLTVRSPSWSLAQPGPRDAIVEVRWQ
jgi:hypothetical protein